ncbi:type VI secretion system baseplate subunit TssK [Limnobaculum zhutongyuii]|uniref:Type VI secretion system baseplate subunit TssK n=1 Tax=Limnobaculum zhutongyuii TaxID=2498113 RepID=A0A411WJ51_9GAMM|nr:type VI secretion system baseplate subunit TssK [Limnobaculum zhutongyuii]QBH96213.1 type VI secretion system baseplate subunit TssK [Limnobaculum zhutongyuii]TQS87347.1 type VI secretion system baseplate subunit TssK [Limnobaculum zhutongyuii]
MKIHRPLWSEGAFLSPEQFQQQSRWEAFSNDQIARLCLANPWGVQRVAFDAQALTLNKLNAESLSVRFPDGSWIDTDVSDALPPARDLKQSIPADRNEVTVLLGLPLLHANGGNCHQEGNYSERPLRYRQEWIEIQDLFGQGNESIAVERYALTLLFDFEEQGDYLTCPLVRLKRDANGLFAIEPAFLPPLLSLTASNGVLTQQLDMLCTQVQSKRQRLMGMRRERNQQMAEFAVADVSLFWLLNALNSHEPLLKFLQQYPVTHPEQLYQQLVSLAGALLTFSLEHDVEAIPSYQHNQLNMVFPPLFKLIGQLLEASLPSRVIAIDLVHSSGTRWSGRLQDSRLTEDTDFYLSVRSSLPAHQLLELMPVLCKVGSPDDVNQIINSALSGVPLKALSHVPAAIPLRLDNQYFALDLTHPAAQSMLAARCCEFYVPRSLPDVSLELFAVLKS